MTISSANVRYSAVADTWYPGTAATLRRTVEGYLGEALQDGSAAQAADGSGRIVALVSPHAGYVYSGPTAAYAYAQLRRQITSPAPLVVPSRVVLLGPLHRMIRGSRLGALMVAAEDAYRTPLGDVQLDRPFIDELGKRVNLTPVRMDEEHSLEIQLPFLQVVLGSFGLVPIMLGEHIADPGTVARLEVLASALAGLAGESTLLVVSTDLTHLNSYRDVIRIDQRLLELVQAFDVDGLSKALQAEQVQACGAGALVTALRAAQKQGASRAAVLHYTTSGDVTGDTRPGAYCVGYMAAAVYA